MQWITRTEKTFNRHYALVSANMRLKLCKIQNNTEVLKAFEQNLSKNEVSKIDVYGKKSCHLALQTPLGITRVNIRKINEQKLDTQGIRGQEKRD